MKQLLISTLFLCFWHLSGLTQTVPIPIYEQTNVHFEENKGQVKDQNWQPRMDVRYSGSSQGMAFHIRQDGISYQLRQVISWRKMDEIRDPTNEIGQLVPDTIITHRVDITWEGFNPNYTIEEGAPLIGYNNYYNVTYGNEPALFVKSYKGIWLKDIYPGIDLHYYQSENHLKYDYLVSAGADFTQIRWTIKGAEAQIDEQGNLIMQTPLGKIVEEKPKVYQDERLLPAKWKLQDDTVGFEIMAFDANKSLQIDPPVLLWGTYYGGDEDDIGRSCTVDESGNTYLSGETTSTKNIATVGAHQTVFGGFWFLPDAFLIKFGSSGTRKWATYYGGKAGDYGYTCLADKHGYVFLAGASSSDSAITTFNGYKDTISGGSDIFLVKFDSSGVRQWGTYYGGSGEDLALSCALDFNGDLYLSGTTNSSTGIATPGAHQYSFQGWLEDAFLVKFDSIGFPLWGTYYGTSGYDRGEHCETDDLGNVYLVGSTHSDSAIATINAHQIVNNGWGDAFLVKFSTNGIRRWGTYYGGGGGDQGRSCVVLKNGNVCLLGHTRSDSVIATTGAHQIIRGSSGNGAYDEDGFLAMFDSTGNRLWATYFGGSEGDFVYSSSVDVNGNIYLSGGTQSPNNIATIGSHQPIHANPGNSISNFDCFLASFTNTGVLRWSTYYGGNMRDGGYLCLGKNSEKIYLAGWTSSFDLAMSPGGHQTTYGGGDYDAFVVSFDITCNPTFDTVNISTCDSLISPSGKRIWTTSGTFIDTILNMAGCDRIITINLTVLSSAIASINPVICDSYTSPSGNYTWVATGTYMDTIPNAVGCDSLITINLTINTVDTTVSTNGVSISSNATNANYQWLDCNNNYAIIPDATNQSYTATTNGYYAVEIIQNSCTDTSDCIAITGVGMDYMSEEYVSIYPNPIKTTVFIQPIQSLTSMGISLYTVQGQKIWERLYKSQNKAIIDLTGLANGIYIVRINDGTTTRAYRIIKQ